MRANIVRDFFKVAAKDFRHAGTFFPSSQIAAKRIVDLLPSDNVKLAEYGSGNGRITRALLEHIDSASRLFGIEINPTFVANLREINDSRFNLLNGDVQAISKQLVSLAPEGFDAVVSGIPFTFLTPKKRRDLVKDTCRGLKSGGLFIAYQNSPILLPLLKENFSKIRLMIEPRNLPPYFIMVAKK